MYPAEVEAALLTHPSVADAAVIGVPDEEWGERVVAVVEPAVAAKAVGSNVADLAVPLAEHCAENLAGFKCPSEIRFSESLPRGDNGKLLRRSVRTDLGSAVGNTPVLAQDGDEV